MFASLLAPSATRVLRQTEVADGMFELWLEGLASAKPGQFVDVRCEGALLRRPFSVFREERGETALLYHVRGVGTRWMSTLHAGEPLDVLGPLGRPFTPPEPGDRLMLVAGGIGVAPLAFYTEQHAFDGECRVGFRSRSLAAGLGPLRASSLALDVFTEEGALGRQGRVTDGLAERLREGRFTRVLSCGPDAMMRAVAAIASEVGIPCEVSLERPMGCGIGVCLGCAVETREGHYERSCVEGPVFDAGRLVWS